MKTFAHISSYEVYDKRMSKAMMDKLFWVDKVDVETVVDFGCADGTLLSHVNLWLPNTNLIGYDNDPNMVNHVTENHPSIKCTTDWDDIAKMRKGRTALILSSVIHEVYHYSDPKEIDIFWNNIFDAKFDYIVIRDMVPSRSVDRNSDINDVAKVYRKFLHKKELRDFENRWGSIENNKNLVHFLLKYKYIEPNWDREVRENYIPLYREDLLAMLPDNYEVTYHEHFVLPWLRRSVKADFSLEIKDNTHLKMILEEV